MGKKSERRAERERLARERDASRQAEAQGGTIPFEGCSPSCPPGRHVHADRLQHYSELLERDPAAYNHREREAVLRQMARLPHRPPEERRVFADSLRTWFLAIAAREGAARARALLEEAGGWPEGFGPAPQLPQVN